MSTGHDHSMFSQHRQRIWYSYGRRTPPFYCGTLQTRMVFVYTSQSVIRSLPRSSLCLRTVWICFCNVLHSSNSRAWNTTSVRLSLHVSIQFAKAEVQVFEFLNLSTSVTSNVFCNSFFRRELDDSTTTRQHNNLTNT